MKTLHILGIIEPFLDWLFSNATPLGMFLAGAWVFWKFYLWIDKRFVDVITTINASTDTKIANLDAKLTAQIDSKITALDSKIDSKITALDTKIDMKFNALDAKIDMKFTLLDAKITTLSAVTEARFEAVDEKFNTPRR